MPRYRRAVVPGGTFFFTVVTYRRRRRLADPWARRMFGSVIRRQLLHEPLTMDAFLLLEEHLHAIWTLPPGDTASSKRWGWIKREFSRHWLSAGGREEKAPVRGTPMNNAGMSRTRSPKSVAELACRMLVLWFFFSQSSGNLE